MEREKKIVKNASAKVINALAWALLFLISTNDVYGSVDVHGLKLKPFVIIIPAVFVTLYFMITDRRAAVKCIVSSALIPSVIITTWDLIATVVYQHHWVIQTYSSVVLLSFSTYAMALLLSRFRGFSVIRVLIYSSSILSLIGLLQFLLSISNIHFLWASDWWILQLLPRVNGLTYEPSYYALTLFPFFSALAFLSIFSDNSRLRALTRKPLFIIGLAIGLSSSRFTILLAVLFGIGLAVTNMLVGRRRTTSLIGLGSWFGGLLIAFFTLGCSYKFIMWKNPAAQSQSFLAGIENGGATAFDRLNRMRSTFEVGLISPIQGIGIGNLPEAVWNLETHGLIEFNRGRYFPMNPLLEIFASWGALGSLAFWLYILNLFDLKSIPRLRRHHRMIVCALYIGLGSTFLVLNYNQNIFRFYLWLFFGLAVAFKQKAKRINRKLESRS